MAERFARSPALPSMLSRFFDSFRPSDFVAAAAPVGVPAGLGLADLNIVIQIIGGCIGTAFCIWKWRRAAKSAAPVAGDYEV